MTLVVAVADEVRAVMGGDSGSTSPTTVGMVTLRNPKVFRAGSFVVGFALSWRFGQILQYHVDWPEPEPGCDLMRFAITEIGPRIRAAVVEHGFMAPQDDNTKRDAQAILAVGNQIFGINGRLEVAQLQEPYVAIGSGHPVAYGSLYATQALTGLSLERRVEIALEAGCEYVAGLRRPFIIEATAPPSHG
ncbi:MAG: hypothetical protein HC897_06800 [Thermoanaerobaculia bacterium]|nr:hypothetical protein [Thermoanaerobaculia bacterium]